MSAASAATTATNPTGRSVDGERPVVPAAIAHPVVDLVTGPLRPATILATHSAAVLLVCDAGDQTRVVTVLTAQASGVPNGVRTALHAADRPFEHLAVGDAALIGGGDVRLRDLRVHAVRTVRTAVPRIAPPPEVAAALQAAVATVPRGVHEHPVQAFRQALAGGSPATLRAAVAALVGLGGGSTPGGDDVLCGALAALHATGREVLAQQVAVAALHDVAARTPLLSADLLRLAARGHACEEAGAVLRAAARVPDDAFRRTVARLVAIGHTSGADLATGLAIGLAVPTQPLPPRPRFRRTATAVR